MNERFLTPQVIAKRLDLSVESVYRLIKTRKIRAFRFGKSYRINEDDYTSFLKNSLVSKDN